MAHLAEACSIRRRKQRLRRQILPAWGRVAKGEEGEMREEGKGYLKDNKWQAIVALNAGDGAAVITAMTDAESSPEVEDSDVTADVTSG